MDKYIDDFCEKHFYEFESTCVATDTDEFFKRAPRILFKVEHLVGVCVLLILAGVFLSSYSECKILKLCYDICIGLLASTWVALIFAMRDKRIAYYEEVVDIIKARMQKIEEASAEANEHMMNKSADDGFHMLQSTAQNAYEFAGYLEDRFSFIHGMDLTKNIEHKVTIGNPGSDKARDVLCSDSRRVVMKILDRLRRAMLLIRQYAYGKGHWEVANEKLHL